MRIAVLGNGGFGTAMALSLARAGREVALWGHDREYTAEIARTRRNPRYLDEVELPASVLVSSDPEAVLRGAEAVLVAVPTQHVRGVVTSLRGLLGTTLPLVSLAKGLEQASAMRPSEVIGAVAGNSARVLVLSGPSHAEEIARGLPTTVVLAGDNEAVVCRLQEQLATPTFRIYRNEDLLGVADGLGYGDNTKAAILARGIIEMARFGVAAGARERTFHGLAGVGDLAVTAFSRHGRNRAFGERIGRGETLEQALGASPKVAEGVWTSRVVVERARRLGVEMPLCEAVCDILFHGLAPQRAVRALMERDPKAED